MAAEPLARPDAAAHRGRHAGPTKTKVAARIEIADGPGAPPCVPSTGAPDPARRTSSSSTMSARGPAWPMSASACAPARSWGWRGWPGRAPSRCWASSPASSRSPAGEVTLPGGQPRPTSFRQAIDRGVAYVSGDRRRLGLMLDKPIWENIVQVRTMGMMRDGRFLRIRQLQERAPGAGAVAGRAHPVGPAQRRASSPGGNQQKVVIAKWLDTEPTTILLDDPTRGVDVGRPGRDQRPAPRGRRGRCRGHLPLHGPRGAGQRLRPGARLLPGLHLRRAQPARRWMRPPSCGS